MNKLATKESGGEFLLYQIEDGQVRINVRLQGGIGDVVDYVE